MYEKLHESAVFLRQAFAGQVPQTALVLGSGLGPLADELEQAVAVPFGDVPHFCQSTAPDHAGRLVCGQLAGKTVLCMQGRLHGYEGYTPAQVAYPIVVFRALGMRQVILTNAAGGINEQFAVGDFMVVDDHINFTGKSPLTGPNDARIGPRFNDMCHVYPKALRQVADDAARACGISLQHGVYVGVNGPQYETPAEIRMFRTMGGDAVGMSTVFESIAAAHCGLPVLAISMITNLAAGITGQALSDEEVKEMAQKRGEVFRMLMKEIVKRL
nr:purine-nucleoside phosphorylase [uncultured Butyricicoccus sp.]